MGVELKDNTFFMLKKDFEEAFKRVMLSVYRFEKREQISNCIDLEALFNVFNWNLDMFNPWGDDGIYSIEPGDYSIRDYGADELIFFKLIAPYVQSDSILVFEGMDCTDLFRWRFSHKVLIEEYATLIWKPVEKSNESNTI